MNTSKAKNVLIIVFLSLNLFLGYLYMFQGMSKWGASPIPEELERMRSIITEYNYELGVNPGIKSQTGSFITVKPLFLPEDLIIDRLLGNTLEKNNLHMDNKKIIQSSNGILEIYKNGLIVYLPARKGQDIQGGIITEDAELNISTYETVALDFLHRLDIIDIIDKNSFSLLHKREGATIYFFTHYNGLPVFSSYMSVYISEGRVVSVEINLLEVEELMDGRVMEVLPASVALTRLLEELGPTREKKVIKKITLGYFSQDYDAEKWEVPPTWRITFDSGEIYYVNAFIGNIEPGGSYKTEGDLLTSDVMGF